MRRQIFNIVMTPTSNFESQTPRKVPKLEEYPSSDKNMRKLSLNSQLHGNCWWIWKIQNVLIVLESHKIRFWKYFYSIRHQILHRIHILCHAKRFFLTMFSLKNEIVLIVLESHKIWKFILIQKIIASWMVCKLLFNSS